MDEAGKYIIWSNEHQAWWRPDSAGYTVNLASAGCYTREEAIKICSSSRDGWRGSRPPPEMPILADDALDCDRRFRELTAT